MNTHDTPPTRITHTRTDRIDDALREAMTTALAGVTGLVRRALSDDVYVSATVAWNRPGEHLQTVNVSHLGAAVAEESREEKADAPPVTAPPTPRHFNDVHWCVALVRCPQCDHGIDPHGANPGGPCGVWDATGTPCPCLLSPDGIASARILGARADAHRTAAYNVDLVIERWTSHPGVKPEWKYEADVRGVANWLRDRADHIAAGKPDRAEADR